MATHISCGNPVTFDRNFISDGNVDDYPVEEYGNYYAAACLHCDEDLFESEIQRGTVPEDVIMRVYDALIVAGKRALADELVEWSENRER